MEHDNNVDVYSLQIEELGLRTRECLRVKHTGIEYIGELVQYDERRLLRLLCTVFAGRKTLNDIKGALAEKELGLGMDPQGWIPPNMKRLSNHQYDSNKLIEEYPAQIHDKNKQVVFDMGLSSAINPATTIAFSRWQMQPLSKTYNRPSRIELYNSLGLEGYFEYKPTSEEQTDWHMNFAHEELFACYGGSLFAQDEMQVAEHPVLASLRECLVDSNINRLTEDGGVATPILISGVERRCCIDISPNASEGKPDGLYGNNFSEVSTDAIKRATEVLNPPTISNIIAMESPPLGRGRYTRDQIGFILSSAYTGFKAAVALTETGKRAAIHTGYWGCGAYGGNRDLMALLQIIAAQFAKVDTLYFYTGVDATGYNKALKLYDDLVPADIYGNRMSDTEQLIDTITALEFQWGVSNGT